MANTVDLTATPRNSIGGPLPIITITWGNTAPTVASVTVISPSTARITGLTPGSADITATVNGVLSNVAVVTVSAVVYAPAAYRYWVVPTPFVS